ncbi:hypothetical protein RSK20926_00987 [Roseobacter sp. SK209-2-6]|nr:hypothetical protein RSK20926_00987 [Roseobacter sp. SK209-2-6]
MKPQNEVRKTQGFALEQREQREEKDRAGGGAGIVKMFRARNNEAAMLT